VDDRLQVLVPTSRPAVLPRVRPSDWTCFDAGAGELGALVRAWPACGNGRRATVAVLPAEFNSQAAATLAEAVHHALRTGGRAVLVHQGAGGASLLRVLQLEQPSLTCLAIEVSPSRQAMAAAHALASAPPAGVCEAMIDRSGRVRLPAWSVAALPSGRPPLASGDRVVITGGLGGLGFQVARMLVRRFGVHPVLVDCAEPAADQLESARTGGLGYTCLRTDVTDAEAVAGALRPVGPVTALLHCAGVLDATPTQSLSAAALQRHLSPKVLGLRSIVEAMDLSRLRVVLAFGSMVARFPHRSMAAYALANELLRREVDRYAGQVRGVRWLTAEWSLWDGAGMAAEMGAVEAGRRMGIVPIPLREGLRAVECLLAWSRRPSSALVGMAFPQLQTRAWPARSAGRDLRPGGSEQPVSSTWPDRPSRVTGSG